MLFDKEQMYEIKDGESLHKALYDVQAMEKKYHLYADMAFDDEVKRTFESAAQDIERAMEKLKRMAPKYMS